MLKSLLSGAGFMEWGALNQAFCSDSSGMGVTTLL